MDKDDYNIFDIKYKNEPLGVGKLLISNPLIEDSFFKRAVVLLIDYNAEGAMGMVLNKPIYVDINEVVKSVSCKPLPLFAGGPVANDRIFFIHQLRAQISESEPLLPNVFWSGNEGDISTYLNNPMFDEGKIRPFLGYSGWTAGQLEREVNEEKWVVVNATSDLIFNHSFDDLWSILVSSLGPQFHVWLNFPYNTMMN